MTHDEFDLHIRESLLQCRSSAIEVLKKHGWLLIPDARVELLTSHSQGVFHSVRLDETTYADFAIYEELQGRLHWQFILVASPSARILEGSQRSTEFQRSIEQIDFWRRLIWQEGIPDNLKPSQFTSLHTQVVSYRIIIGQSWQQTPEEQAAIQQSRMNDLRIRSFNWILEKPTHYSTRELEIFNDNGVALDAGASTAPRSGSSM
ncbi:MAG: hypothetical protein KDA78_15765 [Planctomycetaceae bacterium]|nr:hypothetical protein [Planctomycetaceae bacterium]